MHFIAGDRLLFASDFYSFLVYVGSVSLLLLILLFTITLSVILLFRLSVLDVNALFLKILVGFNLVAIVAAIPLATLFLLDRLFIWREPLSFLRSSPIFFLLFGLGSLLAGFFLIQKRINVQPIIPRLQTVSNLLIPFSLLFIPLSVSFNRFFILK